MVTEEGRVGVLTGFGYTSGWGLGSRVSGLDIWVCGLRLIVSGLGLYRKGEGQKRVASISRLLMIMCFFLFTYMYM